MRLALLNVLVAAMVAAPCVSVAAGDPPPEVQRSAAAPQANGAAHSLRTIPEACARIEGVFTGDAAEPYRFAVVRTSANCRPRARFVDAAKAKPSVADGWIFNDVLRVPSAVCPSLQAVVKVWRKPGAGAPPTLDAQGRARLYLEESLQAARQDRIAAVPMYAAQMSVEGEACAR